MDFRKAFGIVSHNILIDKLLKHGLDEQTARWIEAWLNGWAQRVVARSLIGGQQWVQSRLTSSLMIWVMGQSVPSAKLEGMADKPESQAAIQRDLYRLEKRADRNLIKFSETFKVLHLGRNNLTHQ